MCASACCARACERVCVCVRESLCFVRESVCLCVRDPLKERVVACSVCSYSKW